MRTRELPLEHRLQWTIALMAIVSALLVDTSRWSFQLVFIIGFASVASILLADRRGLLRLPRLLVNLIALAAIAPLARGFLESETSQQLTAIAYLLTTWLCVMSFQAKSPRVYGSLMVWSLLLVVVAAVLGGGLFFAILLTAYVCIGITGLAVLHAYREELQWAESAREGASREADLARSGQSEREWLLGGLPVAYQEVSAGPTQGQLWGPGVTRQIVVLIVATALFVPGFFYIIPRRGDQDWRMPTSSKRGTVGFSGQVSFEEMGRILQSDDLAMRVTFWDEQQNKPYEVFGDAYFFGKALCRYEADAGGRVSWEPFIRGGDEYSRRLQHVRGVRVPEGLSLVRQEYLLEPTRDATVFGIGPVYRGRGTSDDLRFSKNSNSIFRADRQQRDLRGQLRYTLYTTGFRNGAQLPLVPYESADLKALGRRVEQTAPPVERTGGIQPAVGPRFPGFPPLMFRPPPVEEDPQPEGSRSVAAETTDPRRGAAKGLMSATAGTWQAIQSGWHRERRYWASHLDLLRSGRLDPTSAPFLVARILTPVCWMLPGPRRPSYGQRELARQGLSDEERSILTRIDARRFPRTIALADEIVKTAGSDRNRLYRARLLQSYFLDPTRFTYSLDFTAIQARRDYALDPIEDFVANHRSGHCEYFASALVMMLRSQNIPARLVVGYMGGEYNKLGGYYQVYQNDAHAWVEVYLEPHEVPTDLYPPEMVASGAWYRLDPTPGGVEEEAQDDGVMNTVDDLLDYAQVLWNDYVLEMNPERQREHQLTSLPDRGNEMLANMPIVTQGYEALREAVDKTGPERPQGPLWSWRFLVLVGIALVAGSYGAARGLVFLYRRLPGWRRGERRRAERARRQVEFYERFERYMQRLGVARAEAQTQREFAVTAQEKLNHYNGHLPPDLAAVLVDLFYRVRFGNQQLDDSQLSQAEQLLKRLGDVV